MIRSLLTLSAAACLLLLVACNETDPRQAGHDQSPRPLPEQKPDAPGVGVGDAVSHPSNTGGAPTRGSNSGTGK